MVWIPGALSLSDALWHGTLMLTVHLCSQPEQGWHQAPRTACSGGKPWKRWVAAGRGGSSSSCCASSTETRGMWSEMCFRGTVRRGCLLQNWLKVQWLHRRMRHRDWSWFHSLDKTLTHGREGRRSWYSKNISDPRVMEEKKTSQRKLIQAHQQFLPLL